MRSLDYIHRHVGLLLSILVTTVIMCIGWQTGLFWDNVLFIHRFGTALMDNGIWNWMSIPLEHDPGHPMLTAAYIAGMWSLFGKSIAVAHWALFPFIFLFCYVLWRIVETLFGQSKWAIAAYLIVLADPTVFTQLMYIGPEVFILCFSGIAILGILRKSQVCQTIGLMALGITSLRGMMLCAGIFLWDLCKSHKVNVWVYIFGALPAVIFLACRLFIKGWIISNPLSPWGSAFGYEDVNGFLYNLLRNGVVLASRIADFGRIVPSLIIFILLLIRRDTWPHDKRTVDILLLTSLVCIVIAVTSLFIINPMGHSYFLWIYIGMILLLISLIQNLPWRKWIYGFSLCALLLGNTIIYPEHISQGWACSLASLPYWSLRQDMLHYMDEQQITPEQTLTFFPFGSCADDVDLCGDMRQYADSWETADYVMASNVCNLDDETLDRLQTCPLIKCFDKRGVSIRLYRTTP